MAQLTLIATVAGASSTTYADAEYAADYFATRIGGDKWPTANTASVLAALLTAMRILEKLRFIGARSTTTQALEWPRLSSAPRERGCSADGAGLSDLRGKFYSVDAIPQPIKDAQCEIAYAMILDPSLNDPALIQASLKTGNLAIDHSKPAATRLRMAYECLSGLLIHGTQLNRA
jgi:hypothetical protein